MLPSNLCVVADVYAASANQTADHRPVTARRDAHRDYIRRRTRQIAYGRWEPWADAEPVRQHVRKLCHGGATYRAIARAAGVSPMTVHHLVNGHRPHAK